MDRIDRIRRVSNSFYNAGLARAQRRDLTGAVQYLKKCLNLNKYHIDGRNLLGLIYYEMGEVSEALVQWVLSMNLKEQNNRADYYLGEIQRRADRLELVSQNVKRYNQALLQAQSGSDDLAVLQLTRVVESNPNFVKAHLLLALLYISHEDYTKAGKSLYKVLRIDKNNPVASWYMSIVKARTGRAEIERRKLKNAFSHRQMQDDDVIIPPSYKENTGWQSVLNIAAGLLLGAAVIFFLVMPAGTKKLNNAHTQELLHYNEQLNQKNEEISSLTSSMETYRSDKEAAEAQLNQLLNSNDSVANQYGILIRILQALRAENLTEAVTLYASFDASLITDETIAAIAAGVKQEIETNGYQTLEDLAYTMWSAGRMEAAMSYYETCLAIRPDNPKVLFYMGMIARTQGQTDRAIELFTRVVTEYADSEFSERAGTQLAELAPQSQAASSRPSILDQNQDENGDEAAGQGNQEAGTAGAGDQNQNSREAETGTEGGAENPPQVPGETGNGTEAPTGETEGGAVG